MQIIIILESDRTQLDKIIEGKKVEKPCGEYFDFCICPFCHLINGNDSSYCSISML